MLLKDKIYHSAGGPGENIQNKIDTMISRLNLIKKIPKTIHIGNSNENTKTIKLNENVLIGHNLINQQESWWRDTFDIRVIKNELIVKRTDTHGGGWGQDIILPIKYNKVLIYNGFPFHYEKIGCILDFCKHFSIEVEIIVTHQSSWIDFYKTKYEFTMLHEIPSDYNHYLFVFLVSGNDPTFLLHFINENIVSFNQNERIKNHIDALPIFRYITLNDKLSALKTQSKPVISFMDSSPDLSFINNLNDFNIYIINKHITGRYNLPNVFLFEDVSASKLFELLTHTSYLCAEDWLPISYSTGCKCISKSHNITLEKEPSFFELFNKREELLHSRDKSIMNLKHMKLFLDFKTNDKVLFSFI